MDDAAKLTEDDVRLLKSKSFAHFTTLSADGSPHTSPVWIDVDPEAGLILVNSREGRVKPRNARRDPRVALSIAYPDDPYTALMIQGRVVEVTRDGGEEHIDELSRRYRGHDYVDHDPEHPRVLIKIRPERVIHYS